jgi:carboxylesterase type B
VRPGPRALFAAGNFADVPYVIGSNADEGTISFLGFPPVKTEAEYLQALRDRYGDRAEAIAAVYPASSYPNPQDALMRVVGDSGLVCGTYDSARRAAAAGGRVYLYNFARWVQIPQLIPLDLRALHGAEIAYVFGSPPPPTEVLDPPRPHRRSERWRRRALAALRRCVGPAAQPRCRDFRGERLPAHRVRVLVERLRPSV